MADLEGEGWSSLESNIIQRIRALEEDPLKVDVFGQLIPLANDYTQRNRRLIEDASVPSSESEFHPHQLCGRCDVSPGRRLSVADGDGEEVGEEGEKEKKLRFRLQVCMLRSLSFKVKRSIAIWLNGLAKQAYSCMDCYCGLVQAKQEIGSRFLHRYEEDRITQFLSFVDDWEEKVAMGIMADRGLIERSSKETTVKREQRADDVGQHDEVKGVPRPAELFAALHLVGSLASRDKKDGIYATLKQERSRIIIDDLPEMPVGIFSYALDDDEAVRRWAVEQKAQSLASGGMCRTGALDRLIRSAIEQEKWQELSFIAKWAPEAFSGALLPKLLSHKGKPEVLSCVEAVLEQGAAVWLHEDSEYPLVILASILDSMEGLVEPGEGAFRWMEAFLFSLLDPIVPAETFEEALKRMANFLLERMQGGHVSLDQRKRALQEGANLLLCWANGDARTRRPLNNVTELYASTLAQFALMGRIPNTVETAEAGERKAALELIEKTFELDKDNLAESMLLLSSQTMRHKSMFKKALSARKKMSMSNGTTQSSSTKASSDEDAVFEKAAADLDVSPIVCSGLWRECYNAFRPTQDAGLFLRPLASLAVFVEPQIQSYIIVKEHKSPNFPFYKEKLKSCLLALSRRLKTMRGSLPTILLDISEESGASGGGSDRLNELCYQRADGLVAATLCPEVEVHRAAQNVIRTTFEEAETRGDCFRCLLQCSPKLALEGIQTYLDDFVTVATNLIEANDTAKWMVRSFSDVVEALCSQTDGLLRRGTPFSLVESTTTAKHVCQHIPSIWSLMCKSIAAIFAKTPSWARVLDQSELVAWFRDVIIFATDVVDQMETFQDAGEKESESSSPTLLQDLSLPLEEASSWLRMNDAEIVEDTREYIVKALQHFRAKVPDGVKRRMLAFIDDQIKIEDAEARRTLLSINQLKDLRHLLDPTAMAIELSDDEDDFTVQEQASKPFQQPKIALTSQSVSSKPTSDNHKKLKQQKLAFGSVNVVVDLDKRSGGAPSKHIAVSKGASSQELRKESLASKLSPLEPWTANKYSSPSSFTSKAVARPGFGQRPPAPAPTAPSRPGSKLAQLRQDFRSSNVSSHVRSNYQRPPAVAPFREIGDPRAPEAKRSFSGNANLGAAAQAAGPPRPQRADDSSSDESSEDEADEQKRRALGLAALAKNGSPVKMRPKPKVTQAPPRRTILLENTNGSAAAAAAAARERERELAERRKRLREAPDYGPLHRSILSWDYFAKGNVPPRLPGLPEPQYSAVKSTFSGAEDYANVFGPMLLLECWAEFQGAKEELERSRAAESPYRVTVVGRSAVDQFTNVNIVMDKVPPSQQPRFSETDVVSLSDLSDPAAPIDSRAKILAKVDAFKPLGQGCRLTLRCCLITDKQGVNSRLVGDSRWEMTKLFSLTTLHREYEALQALPYYDMLPSILTGRASYVNKPSPEEITRAEKKYMVNRPQAEAILGTLTAGNGFSLIQGPPGTGKTKTISSLVAHFMSTRPRPTSNPTPINAGQRGPGPPIKKQAKQKILLCAPSNAAIDELAKRVSDGIALADGLVVRPNVVRIGRTDAMNHSVRNLALEALVEEKLSKAANSESSNDDVSAIHAEIQKLKEERDAKQTELANVRAAGGATVRLQKIDADIRQIVAKRVTAMNKLDEAKDKRQQVVRQIEADRRKVQQEILEEADVICSTLGGAGHAMFGSLPFDFETVVIDEAAQAVELSTLIPLRYGCQRCILVGDPKQLPPVVLSRKTADLGYANSLFLRMFSKADNPIHLLSIQYRMHPTISEFPSKTFYDGKLLDGPDMARLTMKGWHNDEYLGPFQFFDVANGSETTGRGHSITNRQEALAAAFLYERLEREALRTASGTIEGKVGVVSMYKEQVWEVKRTFKQFFGEHIEEIVDFNTVDGFQGQEKDVIIISSVRTNGIGFLSDRRRVNVAVTRAKSNLFIVGHASNLRRDPIWAQFVEMAEKSRTILQLKDPAKLRQPSNRAPMRALPPVLSPSSSSLPAKKTSDDVSATANPSLSKPSVSKAQQRPPSPPGPLMTPAQMRQASSSSSMPARHQPAPLLVRPYPSGPSASTPRIQTGQRPPQAVTSSAGIPILPPSNGVGKQGPQGSRAAPPRPRPPAMRPPRFNPLEVMPAGGSKGQPPKGPRPPSVHRDTSNNVRKRPDADQDEQGDGPSKKALNALFHTKKKPRIATPDAQTPRPFPGGPRPPPPPSAPGYSR